ncbi:MAG: hypothetical protein VKP62_15600 [Candidatus Sericytochromatia bacterium]|nr:hypothetical protein [Candidatus Sericytochromatia bacterium]
MVSSGVPIAEGPVARSHQGVVDLGSNSVRAVIYRVDSHGDLREVENIKRSLRLGGRLEPDGSLGPAAVAEFHGVLRQFRALFSAWAVEEVTAVATAVFRQALNGAAVLAAGETALGWPIRLLSGEEEARYGVLGMLETTPFEEALVVDLGGASVEISQVRARRLVQSISLPFGAVNLTQRFLGGPDEAAGIFQLQAFLEEALAPHPWIQEGQGPLVALGGSARSVARVHMGRRVASQVGIQQHHVPAPALANLLRELASKSPAERAEMLEIPKERLELLPVALAVFSAILGGQRDWLVACGSGLREGLMYERLRAVRGVPEPETMAVRGAERLLVACGGQLRHVRHVRQLALRLYDGLAASPRLAKVPGAREILEVAALLRESGRIVGQAGFEGITFPMVLRSALPALSSVERAKAALVASFRSPKQLKLDLATLESLIPPAAGPGLECLGAILLVAEALDRTRNQVVRDVALLRGRDGWSLAVSCDQPDRLEFTLLDEPLARLGKILKEPVTLQARVVEELTR